MRKDMAKSIKTLSSDRRFRFRESNPTRSKELNVMHS